MNNNVSFKDVSIKYSEADNALDGGVTDLGQYRTITEFFYEEVKNLKVGQISKIIESPNGFHIIQIYNSRNLSEEKEKKYRVSHIIFKENDVLASEDIINKIKEIKQSILNNLITFEDAAKKFSEDASSIKGGDLGWLSTEEIIPELKSIIINQVPGELSEPVKSSFGWHLISVRDIASGQMQLDKDLFERAKRLLTLKKKMKHMLIGLTIQNQGPKLRFLTLTYTRLEKKKLSQNFLTNNEVAKNIVDLLDIKPYDNVIEIGPGDGALTSFFNWEVR